MKKVFAVFVVGGVLFSLSAGASWFLQQRQEKTGDGDEAFVQETLLKPGKGIKPFAPAEAGPANGPLRPALRTMHNPETEGVVQMASNLQNQLEAVRARDQELTVRQKQLELVYQDLRKEREAVNGLHKQVNEEMKSLMDRMSSLEQKATEVNQQHEKVVSQVKEIKKNITEFESAEQTRVKQMAAICDTMEPEGAAEILVQMVDTGKLDTAVKILASMRERSAARILAQFQNRSVAVQLLDKLKGLRPPSPVTQ